MVKKKKAPEKLKHLLFSKYLHSHGEKAGREEREEVLTMQNQTPKLLHTLILIFVCISFIYELQSLLKHFLGLFRQKSPQEEK